MLRHLSAPLFAAFIACAATASAHTPSEAERTQALEIYRHVVSLDTSPAGGQTPAMANYLADRFRAAGFPAEDIHVLPHDNTAGLVVRYRGDGSGGRPILFLAHMDVVPALRSDWERDPFTLVEENGMFYGRGSIDNKAGLVHIAATFLQLRSEGFTPTRDLILWFSGDEETAGDTTAGLLRDHRVLLGDAEFALNSDAGGGQLSEAGAPQAYAVQTAEKTYADFVLTARNPGGHSSVPRTDNAIYELAQALTRVQNFQFPVMWNDTTIAAFRSASEAIGGQEGAALRRFADHPGDRVAARTMSRNPNLSTLLRTTCVATMLNGGHAPNALPQTATANVNCRIFPGVAVADVQAELQSIVGRGVEVTQPQASNSSDASPLRADVMQAVTRAVHANYPGVVITPYMSGGATDGLFFRAAGIPTYGVGGVFMKESDEFAHGLNERAPVAGFYTGLSHWRILINELAGRN